jgi:hypothetical protein
MGFSCCIHKATDTHSVYVILIVSSRQLWLRERASILRYTQTTLPILYWDKIELRTCVDSENQQQILARKMGSVSHAEQKVFSLTLVSVSQTSHVNCTYCSRLSSWADAEVQGEA